MTDTEHRLTELEIKAGLADDGLDTLNRTVFRQQQQIEALQRALHTLRQQMQAVAPAEATSLRDELPPHY